MIAGTIGVFQLNDCKNRPTEIHLNIGLDSEPNSECFKYEPGHRAFKTNLKRVPVPLYAYKLIIDRNAKSGVVLICSNHPFIIHEDFTEELKKICATDVLNDLDWTIFKTGPSKGFRAACSVKDFAAKNRELPAKIANGIEGLLFGRK